MKQARFIAARQARWDQYLELLKALRQGKRDKTIDDDFPGHYRRLCNDLALARSRGYSLQLVNQLQQWVMQGHALLYRPQGNLIENAVEFLRAGFPRLVRDEWRLTVICTLLMFGPMIWLFYHIGTTPEFVYRVLSPDAIINYEQMYSQPAGGRAADDQFFMFAFYIMNNIGVALRTFAGGLLFGVGSAVILLFNGVTIGAVAAHLSFEGYQENFSTFVIGHGAFELPAIVLAGVAGLRLGLALVMPGPHRRIEALRLASRRAVKLLYGVMAMLLLAAGLEAFWSAGAAPTAVKYTIGAILWLAVAAYFLLAGRRRNRRAGHAD